LCEIVSVVTQACKADTQDNVKGILCSVTSFQEVVVGFVTNSTFGIDYSKKTISATKAIMPSGDINKDMREIKLYFKDFKGKHPENFALGEI